MEFLGYSQEYLCAQIRLLQLHSEQLSYMFSRSAAERDMAGQTAGLRASPGTVPSGPHAVSLGFWPIKGYNLFSHKFCEMLKNQGCK